MPRETRRSAEDRASRIHAVQLNGAPAGRSRGTIKGPLPLWFDHRGVTYIRTAHHIRDSDGTVVHHYRAVDLN